MIHGGEEIHLRYNCVASWGRWRYGVDGHGGAKGSHYIRETRSWILNDDDRDACARYDFDFWNETKDSPGVGGGDGGYQGQSKLIENVDVPARGMELVDREEEKIASQSLLDG